MYGCSTIYSSDSTMIHGTAQLSKLRHMSPNYYTMSLMYIFTGDNAVANT